jgi:ketosteroid isomerase-like protein
MRLPTLRLALAAFLCAGVPAIVLADNVFLQQEVICAETGFSRAAENRDLERFLEFVDPDARFASAAVARGKDEIAAAWATVFDKEGPAMRWRPAVTEVSADGRLALSRGPYRSVRKGGDGEQVEFWGHFISTWRKTADGEWLVLFDSGGDSGMTPTEAEVALLESEPDCP